MWLLSKWRNQIYKRDFKKNIALIMTQMFPKFSLVFINVLWYFLSPDTLFMKTKSGSVLLVRLNWTNFSKSLSCVPCGWLFWSTWFMFETILIVGRDFCRLELGKQCWLLSPVVVRDQMTTNNGASHNNDYVWSVKMVSYLLMGILT